MILQGRNENGRKIVDQKLMSKSHQNVGVTAAPWSWSLQAREAFTLTRETVPRWLRVDEGCLWVTPLKAGPHVADLWLQAGDSLALPAGSAWVVEAWSQARLSLLLAQPRDTWRSLDATSSRAWWQSSWFWPWVLPGAGPRPLA
jgi:hypothetical protein